MPIAPNTPAYVRIVQCDNLAVDAAVILAGIIIVAWRAKADEDDHYEYAVALR